MVQDIEISSYIKAGALRGKPFSVFDGMEDAMPVIADREMSGFLAGAQKASFELLTAIQSLQGAVMQPAAHAQQPVQPVLASAPSLYLDLCLVSVLLDRFARQVRSACELASGQMDERVEAQTLRSHAWLKGIHQKFESDADLVLKGVRPPNGFWPQAHSQIEGVLKLADAEVRQAQDRLAQEVGPILERINAQSRAYQRDA